jgi:S-DNA-T family DNA segregation ATPase FtsK/SpoIIIE
MLELPWNGPAIGHGGYLGSLGHGILRQHFGVVGTTLIAMSVLLFGVIVCTDYFVFKLAVFLGATAVAGAARRPRLRQASAVQNRGRQPAVRIGGKAVRQDGLELTTGHDDVEEDEDEEEDEEELEEELGDEDDEDQEDAESQEDDTGTADSRQRPNGPRRATTDGPGRSAMVRRLLKGPPTLRLRKPPDASDRQAVMARLDEASRHEETRDYDLPPIDLLIKGEEFCYDQQEKEVRRKAKILEKTFQDFGFTVKVVEIETGPVIAQYEVELEAGLRLSKITGLADDLAIALRVPSVRIVAPIPGKNTVGIEVPNEQRQVVRLREVMEETNGRVRKMRIPLFTC